MALGLKLADPCHRIVQIVGDGAFHFSSPDSAYAVSQQYRLPIFTVILDNGGWHAVKASVQRVYPDGEAQRGDAFLSRLRTGRQDEQRHFIDIARAFGAHGERVSDPEEIDGAITRCLCAVDAGCAAVMHVDIVPL
jgi:acetolactate synthase I/II/III large subunit